MVEKKRNRSIGSVSNELLKKSREAALAAVQVFNNPAITFKSEIFVVMMVIAWTYLLHSYYRKTGVEYRHHKIVNKRKRFDKTKRGADKYWELETCLNYQNSPIDKDVANNLRFLIGLRHEIEHQMTNRIDEFLSARFQACCLNFNDTIKKLFGDENGIDKHLSFSLQFASLDKEQINTLSAQSNLPANIQTYISQFDDALTEAEFNNPRYAYRILFVPKTANRKGQADKVIEFIKPNSELAKETNIQYALIKETEKQKFLPSQIVNKVKDSGFPAFNMTRHTELWQSLKAKDPKFNFGCQVANTWYWYENWLNKVLEHCRQESI